MAVSGGAHLSVALALGAALPSTEFHELEVLDASGQTWHSPSTKSRVAVFVTLLPQVDHDAFQHLIELGPGFDIAVALSAGDGHIDAPVAGCFSRALIAKVREVASVFGRSEDHLADHGPYGLGVLLGRHLNTLRTVVYEWTGDLSSDNRYVPVMTLEPGVGGGPIVEENLTDS